MASSLYYIAAALLLPDSLDRVAMGDWSVALVEFASMRPWVLQIAVILVLGALGAPDEVLLVATDQLVRIEILGVLAVVTVIDRVEDHSSMATRGRSLLAAR